jgi:simple sugar transport system permease protein
MKFRLSSKYIPLVATALVLIGLYAAGCLSYHNFFSLRVIVNLFGGNAVLGVAAIGATFVILSGGIDLSVGSVIAFTTILVATLVEEHSMNPFLAISLALVVGTLFGAGMGCLIQFFELPPFLVTLAGMFFMRGMAFVVRADNIGIKHSDFYSHVVNDKLAIPLNAQVSWPFTATCFVVVFLAALFCAHYTRFGRNIYALGGDENSARLMGLPVARTKIMIYALAGFCSALAGAVYTFNTGNGDPAATVGKELEAIAAVVIGGTLLSGGVGFMAGTAMGVLILGLIQIIISYQNLNSWWTYIVVGGLLLLFILLQNLVASASKRVASGHG